MNKVEKKICSRCSSFVTFYSLLVTFQSLLITFYLSFVNFYLFSVTFYLLSFTCHLFVASKQEEFQIIKYEILVTLFYKWEVIETASNNLKETKIFIRRYVMLPNNVMLFFCFLNLQMIFSRISQNYCWEYWILRESCSIIQLIEFKHDYWYRAWQVSLKVFELLSLTWNMYLYRG